MLVDRDLPQSRLPRSYSWYARVALLALGGLAAACGGSDLVLPPGGPAAIRVVEGDGQQGPVGGALGAPLIVEVTDAGGDPMEGATVEFAFTSAGAGAEIAPSTVLTGEAGRAQAHVLLGDKLGLQTGVARVVLEVGDDPTTTFSALAVAGENRFPRAEFDWLCDDLSCRFTESSSDPDGEVAGWAWAFGDGDTSTEREPTHRYATPGTYTVTLTVTDDGGGTDASSHSVNPKAPPTTPPSNQPPRAEFEISCQDLRCTFTDLSTDADGNIQSREWSFGDGATSTQRNPSHTYDSPGQYDVVLVVTDNGGAEDSRTRTAEPESPAPPPPPPPPSNKVPRADFEVSCQDLRCTFTDRSTDEDGSIASRQWDFGDGAASTDRNPTHSYAVAGRYDVLLVVTDDDGAADSQTRTAEAESPPGPPPPPPPPANEPPRAEFEAACQELRCTFVDRSEDDDGSIASWAWSFGDGSSSTDRNPSHTYASPGNYEVLLVATDDDGAADTRTHSVRAEAPPPPPPPPANERPKAEFDVRCDHLSCAFEDRSEDEDGTIVSWAWSFGDGATSTERSPVHTYAAKGRYDVVLTVTDDQGGTGSKNRRADPKD